MQLDLQTLSVVTVVVTASLGALLVFAGLQNRSIRAPMWWGTAQIIGASGLGLATSHASFPEIVSVDFANALVLFGYGLTWAGARRFDGRRVQPALIVLAPMFWLFACRIPAFAGDPSLRLVALSAMQAMLAAATAEEFWHGRDEQLISRCGVALGVYPVRDVDTLLADAKRALYRAKSLGRDRVETATALDATADEIGAPPMAPLAGRDGVVAAEAPPRGLQHARA